MNDQINNKVIVHPAESIRMALLQITRKTLEKDEGERLINALFAYFREAPDSKIRAAEDKVESIKYTLELSQREVKALMLKNEAQSNLLKENGIRNEMNNLYHKLCDVMGKTQ